MSARACDPAVIGGLALLQSAFPVMPIPGGVASLVEAGLLRVPGVASARLELVDDPAGASPSAEDAARGIRRFGLDTLHARVGWLDLSVADAAAFAPYEPFVANLASAIAVHVQTEQQRARLERMLAERTRIEEALREADRRKDEFLGMLSHELRNPLAPIRSSLYILERAEPDGEQARRAREVVGRQVQHLTRLVDDLLDITRISRGKLQIRRGRLDLRALVCRTADDHRPVMQERGIVFEVEAPPEPIPLHGDETRLAQAIGNLLQNAAKFTPAGDRVALSLQVRGGEAELHVRDTGAGIAAETLAQVFEPFTQAEQTLARSHGGLGLGLPLVKRLVELHGGSVAAASAGPGHGSHFTVRLPLPDRPVERAAAPAREAPAATRARRVLVVDDNRDAAESLAELVSLYGHEVKVAYDGPSAVASAQEERPDVVLCDIGLPGMDGYAVARELRGRVRETLRLVAVSGYATPEDLARATEAGFDAHVAKPADPDRILRLLA